jgi:hypothetical protein
VASSGRIQVPVTLDTYGIRGGSRRTLATASAKGRSIGSIIREW